MKYLYWAFAYLIVATALWAQQTNVGDITGTVQDSSGAMVPSAQVVAVNTSTGVSNPTVTTSRGVYTINFLPIGSYTISVTKPGFRVAQSREFQVIAGQTITTNVTLELGASSEHVTVTATPDGVNGTDTQQGTTRTLQELQDLPISLEGTAARAAVSAVQTFSGVNFNIQQSSGQAMFVISRATINGLNGSAFGYQIDGVEAGTGEAENGQDFMAPTPSQVAEVRVTSNTDASQGFNAGTSIALIMKSGTNQFHGTLDYYNRNDALEARNWFLPVRAEDKQNEGGWTLGGPVRIPHVYNGKDRTFFFLSMDVYRYVTTATPPSTPAVNSVPTAQMRAGDFSELLGKQIGTDALGRPVFQGEIYDPSTTRSLADGTVVRDPFINNGKMNVIPASRLSSISQFFGSHYSAPTSPGVANNWVGTSAPTVIDKDQISLKIDHTIGTRHRFSFDLEREIPWFDSIPGCPYGHFASQGSAGYVDGVDASVASVDCRDMRRYRLSYTFVVTPTTVFSFRGGVTRDAHRDINPLGPEAANAACQAGLKGTLSCNTPRIAIENFSAIGPTTWLQVHSQRTPFSASVTWSKGNHSFAFGADYVIAPFVYAQKNGSFGSFNFSHLETSLPGTLAGQTGAGIASYYLGLPDSSSVANPTDGKWNVWEGALYAQDKWRVTPKLTINYGLRWELTLPNREIQNKISSFDPNLANPGAGNKLGALAIGLKQVSDYYYKAFGPRLGVAYSLDSKSVVRANFGISYFPYWSKYLSSQGPATPSDGFNQTKTLASLDNGVTPVYNWQDGFPYVFPSFPIKNPSLDNNGPIAYVDPRFIRPPLVENLGAEVERALPGHIMLRVGYVGTLGHRQYASYNLNALPIQYLPLGSLLNQSITSPQAIAAGIPLPYPGFTGTVARALTPFPQYTTINDLNAQIGNSSYNSLQINVQRHFGSLTFLANATFAKYLTTSDNPGQRNDLATLKAQTYQQSGTAKSLGGYNTAGGVQSGDIPKQMNLSWYWDVPVGKGKHFLGSASKIVDSVLGNWRLSAIQNYQDGSPIGVTSNQSIPSLGATWPVLNQGVPIETAGGCGAIHPGTADSKYLNRAAFSDAAQFTLGNVNVLPTVRTCPYYNEDIGVDKGVKFGETGRVSVGAIMTNVFNRHQFRILTANIDNPSFGTFSAASFPRSLQLYMKLVF